MSVEFNFTERLSLLIKTKRNERRGGIHLSVLSIGESMGKWFLKHRGVSFSIVVRDIERFLWFCGEYKVYSESIGGRR